MDFLVPSFVLVGLDSLYLKLSWGTSGMFGRTVVKNVQGSELED